MNGSYVRGCAIHKTFNRMVNIHNTHELLIEHNVGYDIMGGAIFLEDSIEMNNVMRYNFLARVKSSSSLQNDDISPAAFWVTHPTNDLLHNHVASGTHFGIWYRILKKPSGPSFNPNACPQAGLLGQVFNNTVHSVGWYGLWIFEDYHPRAGGQCNGAPVPAKFGKLVTWNSFRGAEWVNCDGIQFHDFIMANNFMANFEHYHISGRFER
jgi:hypothetical protein